MDVSQENAEYVKYKNSLAIVDSVYQSSEAAVNNLLQYAKEKNTDFIHRKGIAILENYVEKAVNGASDIIFRKPIDITAITSPDTLHFFKNVNYKDDLDTFAKDTTMSYNKDGQAFILVEAPKTEKKKLTKADAAEIQPYFVHINRNSIVNYKKKNNKYTHVTIKESYDSSDDIFKEDFKVQYRVLQDNGIGRVFRDGVQYDTYTIPAGQVPIIEIGDVGYPPLLDLAKTNLTQMNRESELQRYLRIAGSPFIAVFGRKNDDGVVTIGVDEGMQFDSKEDGDVKWVEMTGKNAETIQAKIDKLREAMIDKAVSFATTAKVLTATQVEKNANADESILSNTAQRVEQGINQALALRQIFLGTNNEEIIALNKDFDSNILTPEQWKEYRTDYVQGVISWETYRKVLQEGEVYQKLDDKQLEEEKVLTDEKE